MNTNSGARDSNIWELKSLNYEGPLYHYTGAETCEKIFNPQDVPKDCALLWFARIESMTRNDTKERRHIRDTMRETADRLLFQKRISNNFKDIVLLYEPNDEGIYRIATDEIHPDLKNNIVKIDYGLVDYFVACFSICPNNAHIITELLKKHSIVKRIDFRNWFSSSKEIGYKSLRHMSYPFVSLDKCFLEYDIKQVVYDDAKKSELLETELIEMSCKYESLERENKDNIRYDLQALYVLYEAFFKGNEDKYKNEKEVRFVVRIPRKERPHILAENRIAFGKGDSHIEIPIAKDFIIGEPLVVGNRPDWGI